MLAEAGLRDVPDGTCMIPETDAAHLHQLLRRTAPDLAADLASEAGRGTADYILAHRIPKPVRIVLKLMPAPLAARVLSQAIAKHAWTFAGSGAFRVVSPWCFDIADNPIVRGEHSAVPLCHWQRGTCSKGCTRGSGTPALLLPGNQLLRHARSRPVPVCDHAWVTQATHPLEPQPPHR